MKLLRRSFFHCLMGVILATPLVATAEPVLTPMLQGEYAIPNLGITKNLIRDYVKSGKYNEETGYVSKRAKAFLDQRLQRPVDGKPAIIFDVDETALSNFPHIVEMDFGYIPALWNTWVDQAKAPAIEGALDLYRYARSKGVSVIFITGRNQNQRTQTENNLRQVGYEGWTEMILRPVGSHDLAESFKAEHRRRLTQSGYTILLNLGDQHSDFTGGYSESVFKLPNPMYWVP